jgi:hypothetical protein
MDHEARVLEQEDASKSRVLAESTRVVNSRGQTVEQCARYLATTHWRGHHRIRSAGSLRDRAKSCEVAAEQNTVAGREPLAVFYRDVAQRLTALATLISGRRFPKSSLLIDSLDPALAEHLAPPAPSVR